MNQHILFPIISSLYHTLSARKPCSIHTQTASSDSVFLQSSKKDF